ncbi:MAG: carboxylating nicotinate-nucleotide diphosphorylase [Phycisphaeraceae bacterium]|nr:MAG: carboxylating nicotinate-nucleotide diphosphorylase [Phycisphaeraceae bacterium]
MPDPNALSLSAFFDLLNASSPGKPGLIRRLFELARDEDLGTFGDVTSRVFIGPEARGRASIIARAGGVVAGLRAVPEILAVFAPGVTLTTKAQDGERVGPRTVVGELSGPLSPMLAAERTLLNTLGRMSGIATLTARYTDAVAGTKAKILDTRKTTPGLRGLEKYAVRCGGGTSHRLGLYDSLLIKDNHLAGIPESELPRRVADAVMRAKSLAPITFSEVEADTFEQASSLIRGWSRTEPHAARFDVLLLDNMDPSTLRRVVELRDTAAPGVLLEASGGVNLQTVAEIAGTGVDRVSVGSLTHAAVSLDVALDVVA